MFRTKEKKRVYTKNKKTLDAKHKEKVKYFKDLTIIIKEKEDKINILEKQLKKLEENKEEIGNIIKIINIRDEICNQKKQLKDIHNRDEENDYYLKNGELLFEYYNNKNKKVKTEQIIGKNTKSVLDFFGHREKKETFINDDDNDNKCRRIKKIQEMSISKIHNEYLANTKNIYVDNQISYEEEVNTCPYCSTINLVLHLSEGLLICNKCGYEKTVLIDSDKPSYKEPPKEVQYYSYKRINHFNEWLAQFQAKETTQIPQEVYDKILLELKKERITNMVDITRNKIKQILKKLKFNKYYEHIPHIINKLNGIPAPVMSREIENMLRRMFKEIQVPFHKHCPKNRKNFLSYSFVLHKFVQLLSMDEFTSCFPLLKSREKLHQQDVIWKKICKELHWEFVPSL